MKILQSEQTSFCCFSFMHSIQQQCKETNPPASGFKQTGKATTGIRNAHSPPAGFLYRRKLPALPATVLL